MASSETLQPARPRCFRGTSVGGPGSIDGPAPMRQIGNWRSSKPFCVQLNCVPRLRPRLLKPCTTESWIAIVKRPQCSSLGLYMASAGNSAQSLPRYQSPSDLLHPRPASVRALTSLLLIKCQSTPPFSFRAPGRAHPFHFLLHPPRPVGHWSLCMVPCLVSNGDQG